MIDPTTNQWHQWRDAARRDAIDRAIRGLYADLDAAVAERGPLCNASGRCCDFDAYGHRLYVTGLEIAWFLLGVGGSGLGSRGEPDACADHADNTRRVQPSTTRPKPTPSPTPKCPFQIDGLCSTHAIRPLGCRVYFCERGTEAWQQDTTERFLDRLKRLHAEHALSYGYMEWRAGLAEAKRALASSP
ncbi:MAG: hypothetical protein ACE37H_15530 [Phycisphaeraceae bacterium]